MICHIIYPLGTLLHIQLSIQTLTSSKMDNLSGTKVKVEISWEVTWSFRLLETFSFETTRMAFPAISIQGKAGAHWALVYICWNCKCRYPQQIVIIFHSKVLKILNVNQSSRDRMVVGFTTTCTISASHH